MPEPISRDTAVAALINLGYRVLDDEDSLLLFGHTSVPIYLWVLDFSQGAIPWDDFRQRLEYEGIDVARFLAEMESLG